MWKYRKIYIVETICLVTRKNTNSLNCTELNTGPVLQDPQRFQFPKNFIKVQIGDKDMHVNMIFKGIRLRVVHTKPILFKITLSERDGSGIDRLKNWIPDRLKMTSFKFRVVLCRIRLFPTLISKMKWVRSELPFNQKYSSRLLGTV